MKEGVAQLMTQLCLDHHIPLTQQMRLLTRLRLAKSFSDYHQRVMCVLVRLQAICVLGMLTLFHILLLLPCVCVCGWVGRCVCVAQSGISTLGSHAVPEDGRNKQCYITGMSHA